MGETTGIVTQNFRITVDMSKLTECIVDNILDQINKAKEISYRVDLDEYYIEDDSLEIVGTYDTNFKSYYSPATRYEPAEEDMQRFYIGEDGVGLLDTLPENIQKLIDVSKVEEKEDDAEYQICEPDDNDAYDRWKDRQLEGDY